MDSVLNLKNLRIKYRPSDILFRKNINLIYAESVYIQGKNIKLVTKSKGETSPKNFLPPVTIKELKINGIDIKLDEGKSVSVDYLFVTTEGNSSFYRIRAYLNRAHAMGLSPYVYGDFLIRRNLIKINTLEISDERVTIAGLRAIIHPFDSLNMICDFLKFDSLELRGLSGTFSKSDTAGEIQASGLRFKKYEINEIKALYALYFPDSVSLKIKNARFRENTGLGELVFDLKKKKLKIKKIELSVQEEGLTGTVTATAEFQNGSLAGTFISDNLVLRESKPFQIAGEFQFQKDKVIVSISKIKSDGTDLRGTLAYDNGKINIYLNGLTSLEDLDKSLSGKAKLDLSYYIHDGVRKGKAYILGTHLKSKVLDIDIEKAELSLFSQENGDSAELSLQGVNYKDNRIEEVTLSALARNFQDFVAKLSAKTKTLNVNCALKGSKNKDVLQVTLLNLDGNWNSDSFKTVSQTNFIYESKKGVSIADSLALTLNDSPIIIRGGVNQKEKTIKLEGIFSTIPVHNVYRASGIISGSFVLEGYLSSPQFFATLRVENLEYQMIHKGSFYTIFRIGNENFFIDSLSIAGTDLDLNVNGHIPVEFSLSPFQFKLKEDFPFYFQAKINQLPLNALADLTKGQFILSQGNLYGEISITGSTLSNPEINGFLNASNLSGVYTPISLEFTKGEIFTEFRGDGFVIKQGKAYADKGKLKINGYGTRLFSDSREINIELEAQNVSLYPVNNIFANGDGKINLEFLKGLTNVKGDFFVKEATIFQSLRVTPSSKSSAPPSNLNLLINITSDGNTFLVNELGEVEFKGKITFQMTEGKYFLDGTAEAIRGYFLYIDRIFEIEQGYVNFTSTSPLEPDIYIKAKTTVDTFVVSLIATGSLQNLNIKLISDPSLDELNILYLLTTGKSYGDTTTLSSGELQELKTRALSLASTILTQSIRRTLRLHELKFESSPDATSSYVTVGMFVTSRLYFWYSHDLFDITRDLFKVRYKIQKNIGIFAERNQDQNFLLGADFIYEF
ncbi:MAG: translocation/assembly module TamB domain-containing protein [Candidatus Hydrothermia bacterium]